MVMFTVLGGAVYLALPMLVGALVDGLHFTPQQAGFVAAGGMLGASISALLVSLVVSRGRWRRLLLCATALLVITDGLLGLIQSFPLFLALRLAGGLGEGVMIAIGNASIAETRDPDRGFGFSAAGQLAFGSAALFLMPALLSASGLRGIFWSFAVLTAMGFYLMRCMPDGPRAVNAAGTSGPALRLSRESVLGLAGVFAYFVSQGAVWTYLDRIGAQNHLDMGRVGHALAICSMAGLAGACLASWLSTRLGRLKPLLFAMLCTVVSLMVLSAHPGYLAFAAMASLFNFAWNVSVPYQFGLLAEIDASRRTIVLGGVMVFAGLTAGPAMAACIIQGDRVDNVTWMGIGFCLASFALFAWLIRPLERVAQLEPD
jgi:predicted MFS family arabinose efflux permease